MGHHIENTRGRIAGKGCAAFLCSTQDILTKDGARARGGGSYYGDNGQIETSNHFPVRDFPGKDGENLLSSEGRDVDLRIDNQGESDHADNMVG